MLSSDQVRFYEDQGYLLLSGIFDSLWVDELRHEADEALERAVQAGSDPSFMWDGKYFSDEQRQRLRISGIHDMQFQSAAYGRMLYHDPLLDAVESLIGPNIQLHHTKLIVKPPESGAPFPMHQDYPYFPHERHTMLAVTVHLDDTTEANGCMRIVPGSHKLGPLNVVGPKELYLPPADYPLEAAMPIEAMAGDALIFNYLTIHGSGLNTSGNFRRNILIQMRDPADLPTTETHASRGQGMMLRGANATVLAPAWA